MGTVAESLTVPAVSVLPSRAMGMTAPCEELQAFGAWLRSWGAADSTIRARLSVLANLYLAVDLATATPDQLAAWLGNPAFEDWTRVTYFSHLRSFYEWMRKSGRRPDDPTVDMRRPREPKRRPWPLNLDEVAAIMAAATGDELTWFALGLFAGLRVFEIAKIRGEDVTSTELFVRGKGGKDALLPTHPAIWDLAQSYPRLGFWFPSPRSASGHVLSTSITARMTRLFTAREVPGSTHRARHTYGTQLLRDGADIRVVQDLMRHSSLATTAGYLGVEDDAKAEAIRGLRLPLPTRSAS